MLILLTLLISPLILANEDGEALLPTEINQEDVKEQLSALAGGLDEKTEDVLSREVNGPGLILKIIKIFLGAATEDITYLYLITGTTFFLIAIALWVSVLEFTTFSEATNYVIAVSMSIIMSMTGVFNKMFSSIITSIEEMSTTARFITFAMILAIIISLRFASKYIRDKRKVQSAKDLGEDIKKSKKKIESFSEVIEEGLK